MLTLEALGLGFIHERSKTGHPNPGAVYGL